MKDRKLSMADEPNMIENTDDQNAFEDAFFEKTPEKAEKPEVVEVTDDEPEDQDETDQTQEAPDGEADDTDEDGEAEDKPEKPKKVSKYQERINELTAKAREAERALAALQAEKDKQSETPNPTPTPVAKSTPKPDDLNEDGSDKYPLGEFDPQYLRDFNRAIIEEEWAAKKEQEAKEQSERQMAQARQELQSNWESKLAPVTEVHEDFVEKTMELESAFDGLEPNYSDYLVQTIKSLDHGPEVLYYFANHLDEAQKFVKMGPLQATLALGEVNAMFKGNSRPEAKVSKAPVPPQVNKGSATRTSVRPDTDDLDAFSDLLFNKRKR